MSDAFDPVAAARVIGEMTAYVKALPPQARQMGDAIVGLCDVMLDARTRDAARIADLTRQIAEAREVKPLEWVRSGGNWQWGNGLFNYEVVNKHGSGSFWWRRALSGDLYQPENDHTESAAKAAAQADYTARILSALKGTP